MGRNFLYQVRLRLGRVVSILIWTEAEEAHFILKRPLDDHTKPEEEFRGAAQWVDHLPSMREALASFSSTNKPGMVVCAHSPSTKEVEAGASEV